VDFELKKGSHFYINTVTIIFLLVAFEEHGFSLPSSIVFTVNLGVFILVFQIFYKFQ